MRSLPISLRCLLAVSAIYVKAKHIVMLSQSKLSLLPRYNKETSHNSKRSGSVWEGRGVAVGRGTGQCISVIKKILDSSELSVLSTMANSNLGSVGTGAVGVVREEQKQDFDQNQDSGPSYS